jgi:hypothetical protein
MKITEQKFTRITLIGPTNEVRSAYKKYYEECGWEPISCNCVKGDAPCTINPKISKAILEKDVS